MNLEQFLALVLKTRPIISLKPSSFAEWATLHFTLELFAHKSPKHLSSECPQNAGQYGVKIG